MPASCEEDLYIQLENCRIKNIRCNTVSVTKMLGLGQFGWVQIGIWNGSKGRRAKVKFLQEAAIMAQFRHPNVTQLYGIVTNGESVMLVFELAHKGDLKTLLNTLKSEMRVPRLIFVFAFCQLGVRIHAALPTCNIFGNNLVQATAARTRVNSLYMKIANAASCAGNVTRWNMCYYSANSDAIMTSYFAVYRPTNGSNYRRIGSAATYDATQNTSVAYVCDHIPIPQSEQYVVLPQDVLAVCLRILRYQAMVASNVTGASVLKGTPLCKSISAMTDTLDVTGYNTIASTTLHVSIDVNECAVNNGGCGQICNDTTPGYSCSCYSGYQLLLDGMNCSTAAVSFGVTLCIMLMWKIHSKKVERIASRKIYCTTDIRLNMKPSASGVSGSNEVDLNENESYQRTQGVLTLQNEAYGVHMHDQGSIMSSPNEAYSIHSRDQCSIMPSPNEAYGIHTRDQCSIMSSPNEAYGIHTRDQCSIMPSPNEACGIDTCSIVPSPNGAYGMSM
eukprot:Em0008g877a